MKRFQDKRVIVTGGANGIGEALVRRLVAEGAKVAVVDIEQERTDEVCRSMPEATVGIVADVRNKAQVDAMVRRTVEAFGGIDILFNNAGIVKVYPFLETPVEEWRDVVDVNLNGCFIVGQAVAKEMVRLAIPGVIVNTASVTSAVVTMKTNAYPPSKSAVMQLTRLMALELAPHGIRVNCFGPGTTITRLTEPSRNDPEKSKMILNKVTTKRFAEVDEIASVGLFLASDEASYVNGSIYYVDGGWQVS